MLLTIILLIIFAPLILPILAFTISFLYCSGKVVFYLLPHALIIGLLILRFSMN